MRTILNFTPEPARKGFITRGRSKIEALLLHNKGWSFLQSIRRDGKLIGYRLYSKGVFNLPSFRGYHWL